MQLKEQSSSAKHYNDTSFYRANPYAHQGYVPNSSLKNRKHPEFMTEIPQGNNYFEPSNRRMFNQISKKSNILQYNILSSPQRFPFENRMALDKNYHRNLNTIDIEGASADTKMCEAMRNKIKAQLQLQKRTNGFANKFNAIMKQSQMEKKRKLAQQYQNYFQGKNTESFIQSDKQKHYSSLQKLPTIQTDYGTQCNTGPPNKSLNKLQPINHYNPQQQLKSNEEVHFDQNPQSYHTISYVQKQGRHDVGSRNRNEQGVGQQAFASKEGSRQMRLSKQIDDNISNEIRNKNFRQQYRKLNPTNLSYESKLMKSNYIFDHVKTNKVI